MKWWRWILRYRAREDDARRLAREIRAAEHDPQYVCSVCHAHTVEERLDHDRYTHRVCSEDPCHGGHLFVWRKPTIWTLWLLPLYRCARCGKLGEFEPAEYEI